MTDVQYHGNIKNEEEEEVVAIRVRWIYICCPVDVRRIKVSIGLAGY